MIALRSSPTGVVVDARAPEPDLTPGHVLVRASLLALATPDFAAAKFSPHGSIPGHECVGVVERAADPAHKSLVGSRVVVNPVLVCGVCEFCRGGVSSQCRARRVMGFDAQPGCLAQRLAVPASNVFPIPERIDDDAAILAFAIAAARHAAALARSRGLVTVLGDGVLGLLCAQALFPTCPNVRLLGRHPDRFSRCERWGIRHRHIADVGLRNDQDAVIDCTGHAWWAPPHPPSGLAAALDLVRPRGRIVLKSCPVLAGPFPPQPADDLSRAVLREVELLGAGFGSINDGIDALERGGFDPHALVTARVSLREAASILSRPPERRHLKILIVP